MKSGISQRRLSMTKNGEEGIFAGYINTFLRIKQESSGYPDWCKTEQDKIKFKQDYFEAEGIRLENVEKNKGMRAIAKIMLNSLWGKLAQRDNMTKTEYFSEPAKFFDLVTNPNKIVKNVDICREIFYWSTGTIQNPMWSRMLAVM